MLSINQLIFSKLWKLTIAIAVCEATGVISAICAQVGTNVWFESINKPSWNPPAYLFGPVWTLLYLMMGIAFWLIWKSDFSAIKKSKSMLIFGIQLFLNFWWSILFFRLHSPGWAFLDIILMVITICITIFRFYPISRLAAWLLVPYLAWVCFATFLNYTIWVLNI